MIHYIGKPVAVIFPPVRDLVISASLCSDERGEHPLGSAGSGEHPLGSAPSATYEIGLNRCDNNTTDANTCASAAATETVSGSQFNLLYVGRLHSLKGPGLLLRALGLLARTASGGGSSGISDSTTTAGSTSSSNAAAEAEVFRRDCYLSPSSSFDESAILEEVNRLFQQSPLPPPLTLQLQQHTLCLLQQFIQHTILTVVGDGLAPLRDGLVQLAASLHINSIVHFVGRRSAADVMQYMSSADLLVNPKPTGK